MTTDPAKIWTEAKARAQLAAQEQNERLGPKESRGFDCGFAWITIKPARGAMVNYLKSIGVGRTGDYGSGNGYSLWYSKVHDVNTQSLSVHQAAIAEVERVFKDNGIECRTGSRLD